MLIYLIGLYCEKDEIQNVKSCICATTSYEAAREKVLQKIKGLKQCCNIYDVESHEDEEKYHWTVSYKFKGVDNKEFESELFYRIEPIDLDFEDVPESRKPNLEYRCKKFQEEIIQLKEQLSDSKAKNSAAQCFLTFYDGGIYEDHDSLIKNINKAKHILRGDEKGNTFITEMFSNWLKAQERTKIRKNEESKSESS